MLKLYIYHKAATCLSDIYYSHQLYLGLWEEGTLKNFAIKMTSSFSCYSYSITILEPPDFYAGLIFMGFTGASKVRFEQVPAWLKS